MSLKQLAAATLLAGVLVPGAVGQKQQLIQLQRDIALLHDQLRQVQEKQSERMAGLEALLRQNTEKQDRLLAGQAVIERGIDALDDALTEPLRVTSAKVDSLTEQFSALRASVEEIGTSIERLTLDVKDVKTHLTTLPVPMEGEEGVAGGEGGVNSSEAIFEGGLSDYLRGNITNARGQFLDYLALYPTHSKADQAQFYLAETYYSAAEYEEAIRQFDQVYKRHPLSPLAPDSVYKQGMSYLKLRKREEAIESFQLVLDRFPDSNASPLSRSELNSLKSSKPSPGR